MAPLVGIWLGLKVSASRSLAFASLEAPSLGHVHMYIRVYELYADTDASPVGSLIVLNQTF